MTVLVQGGKLTSPGGLFSGQRTKWQFHQRLEKQRNTRAGLLSFAGPWVGPEGICSFMKLP